VNANKLTIAKRAKYLVRERREVYYMSLSSEMLIEYGFCIVSDELVFVVELKKNS